MLLALVSLLAQSAMACAYLPELSSTQPEVAEASVEHCHQAAPEEPQAVMDCCASEHAQCTPDEAPLSHSDTAQKLKVDYQLVPLFLLAALQSVSLESSPVPLSREAVPRLAVQPRIHLLNCSFLI